jgi:hypothetical protein
MEKDEENLKTAKGVKDEPLGNSASSPDLVTFEDGSKGVFKNINKEPCGYRTGIGCGQQTEREVGAYEVSKFVGLAGAVPPTVPATYKGKQGAMQRYLTGFKPASAIMYGGANVYGDNKQLSKIAAFDYVIGNLDRHGSNWITTKDGKTLALIDHGLSFPTIGDGKLHGGNSKMMDKAAGKGIGGKDYSDAIKPFQDNKQAIMDKLTSVGLPKDCVEAVGERIDDLADANSFGNLKTQFMRDF